MVFSFAPDGFTKARNGEYVSRAPQRAVSFETFAIAEAIRKWNVQACYTTDLGALITKMKQQGNYQDEQT
jgi:hypothetical protein